MGRQLALVMALAALVLPGLGVPASAAPVTRAELLTVAEVASAYPGLADADRIRSSAGITAPRAIEKDGHLRCDRYRSFRGTSRRHVLFFDTISDRSVALGHHVVRMRDADDAAAVIRHYREYARTCEGAHATTDGEGGRAGLRVRAWPAPRLGDGSAGLLIGFRQHGLTTWRRTLVVRVGATVALQEVEPYSGTGSAERLVALSRLAVARLAD